jgi:hypothetical protein
VVEPPNALTDLLRHKTPEEMYEILKTEQCLTAAAMQDEVIALIKEAEASHRQEVGAGTVGPTREYVIVGASLEASYLNDRARRLLATITVGRHAAPTSSTLSKPRSELEALVEILVIRTLLVQRASTLVLFRSSRARRWERTQSTDRGS